MEFQEAITVLSSERIVSKDLITVTCNNDETYTGSIIKKSIIDPVNDTEYSILIHTVDRKMCLCLKTRPDGLGPDTADVRIYLDEIISISKD